MNKRLDRYLVKSFPLLFADRHKPMTETCLCWGFECGDGWYRIIKEAAARLEPLIAKWIADNPYKNRFPWWIFSRYNMHVVLQWRCYSFLAIWEWAMIGLGLRQPPRYWPCASQVKEKYGTLRLYLTGYPLGFDAIECEAEEKSKRVCELCGRSGKLVGTNWLYTRCYKCYRRMIKSGRFVGEWPKKKGR